MSHPPYDCEDCGVYHMSYTGHIEFAKREKRKQFVQSLISAIIVIGFIFGHGRLLPIMTDNLGMFVGVILWTIPLFVFVPLSFTVDYETVIKYYRRLGKQFSASVSQEGKKDQT